MTCMKLSQSSSPFATATVNRSSVVNKFQPSASEVLELLTVAMN